LYPNSTFSPRCQILNQSIHRTPPSTNTNLPLIRLQIFKHSHNTPTRLEFLTPSMADKGDMGRAAIGEFDWIGLGELKILSARSEIILSEGGWEFETTPWA